MEKFYFVEKSKELSRFTATTKDVLELAKKKKQYENLWLLLFENELGSWDRVWFYNNGQLFNLKFSSYDLIPIKEIK